jgi:ribosomal protein S18 acetylase RimI-like enzyme
VGASGIESNVRAARSADAEAIGRLLHDFNTEFEEPTPGPAVLADRFRRLLAGGDTAALLGGKGPDGLVVLRFRLSLWTDALECYVAELYVAPSHRGRGIGRALMEAAIDLARERGADHIDLATSEDDVAARRLYERLGFRNRERGPSGPVMYVYEREL